MDLRLTGRSSSHFTRTARVFAHALGVEYRFNPVLNLLSADAQDYAGNPALRLPVLETEDGALFGTLNICRELARRSQRQLAIVWPEQLSERLACNAHELVVHGMSVEVGLIMQGLANPEAASSYQVKGQTSLNNTLDWLDQHWPAVLDCLPPERALSFLEVAAYCFLTHLEFRQIRDLAQYANLMRFANDFGQRACARDTAYRYDAA